MIQKRIQGFGPIVCVFSKVEKVMGKQNVARRSAQSKKGNAPQYQVLIKAISTVLVADLIVMLIALHAIGGEAGEIFLQTILFPVAAFVSGFFSLVATKHVAMCLLSSVVVHTLLYCITLGFGVGMILWILLYLINGFVGLSVAYILITHKT